MQKRLLLTYLSAQEQAAAGGNCSSSVFCTESVQFASTCAWRRGLDLPLGLAASTKQPKLLLLSAFTFRCSEQVVNVLVWGLGFRMGTCFLDLELWYSSGGWCGNSMVKHGSSVTSQINKNRRKSPRPFQNHVTICPLETPCSPSAGVASGDTRVSADKAED